MPQPAHDIRLHHHAHPHAVEMMHACHRHPWRGSCAVVAAILLSLTPLHAQQAWEAAPPYGMNVNDICGTANGHILLAGQRVYRSIDTGRSWMVEPSLPSATRLFRMENGTLLAATSSGIRRSTSNGASWTVGTTPMPSVHSFVEVFGGLVVAAASNDSVYVTSDGGLSWTGVSSMGVHDLVSTSLTTFTGSPAAGRVILGATAGGYGVLRSSDVGLSWDPSGLTTTRINSLHATDAGVVYAAGAGIWKSTDGGGIWQRLDTGSTIYNAAYVIAVTDSLLIVCQKQDTDSRLHRTTDAGNTWSAVPFRVLEPSSSPGLNAWLESPQLLRRIFGRGFFGTNWNVYRTVNDGQTWTQLGNGVSELPIEDADIVPGKGWVLSIAPLQPRSFLFSQDEGRTWRGRGGRAQYLFPHATVFHQAIVADSGVFLAVEGWTNKVARSTNTGGDWSLHQYYSGDATTSFDSYLARIDNGHILLHGSHGMFLPGSPGISRSLTNGWTWTTWQPWSPWMQLLKVYPLVAGVLHATSRDSTGLWRSSDLGVTWSRRGLDTMIITSFISPSTSLFFAGTDGDGVYRSTTGGATWVQSTTGITNGKITSLLMATPTNLFAATAGAGVFRSVDSGRTWIPFNTGLDNLYVTVLALDSSRRLLAGTLGGMRRTVMMVPVELASFRARAGETAIHLRWSTTTETNNAGFEIERRIDDHGGWQRIAFIAGSGTSASGTEYGYDDPRTTLPAEAVRLRYRLRQIDHDGSVNHSPEVLVDLTRPARADIQLHPQPLPRQRRSIGLRLGDGLADATHLTLHDLLGRSVLQHRITPTASTIDLPLPALPPGVYRIIVHTPTRTASHPLILE
jgi:hypothetical protein